VVVVKEPVRSIQKKISGRKGRHKRKSVRNNVQNDAPSAQGSTLQRKGRNARNEQTSSPEGDANQYCGGYERVPP
jgi:hypothetical protein